MSNRRQFTRLSLNSTVIINHNDSSYRTSIHDISLKGIFFEKKDHMKLPFNTYIPITILINEIQINMSIFIIRETLKGYAGTLSHIEPEDFYHLKRFLISNLGSDELIHKEIEQMLKEK